jgi:cysteinyl-tRNA synthetase
MARWWFHNEFMTIDGGKMSKSLGNIYTLDDLARRGFSPMHFRYLTLQSNYRTVMNFTWEALTGAKAAYTGITARLQKHKTAKNKTDTGGLLSEFAAALNDDLNTPAALAVLNKAVKMPPSADIYKLVTEKFDAVLSLDLAAAQPKDPKQTVSIPAEITELAKKRAAAKKERNFAAADSLRAQIEKMGYRITDTPAGHEITPAG